MPSLPLPAGLGSDPQCLSAFQSEQDFCGILAGAWTCCLPRLAAAWAIPSSLTEDDSWPVSRFPDQDLLNQAGCVDLHEAPLGLSFSLHSTRNNQLCLCPFLLPRKCAEHKADFYLKEFWAPEKGTHRMINLRNPQ